MEINNNNEVIEIKTTNERFFLEYLTIKKPFLENILSRINNKQVVIHPKPLNVFALLLYYNYVYSNLAEDVKWKMVFDYKTKVAIMDSLGIKEGHLNTYLSTLRNMKLLNGKQISKPFIFYPDSGYELTFKFAFDENK